ncbi:MAG TPA: hypothetical protein VFX16_31240 [Pseudonocardiaceae bacterium]|nr:hypothetical protein [Pseudonocardiaceae bacterium]
MASNTIRRHPATVSAAAMPSDRDNAAATQRDGLGGPRPAERDDVVAGAAVRGPDRSATGHRAAHTAAGGHQEGT